jgi:hypothetical protein
MTSFMWNLGLLCVLIAALVLHNWANAQRPMAERATVRVGSRRWWLPWPRRAEFPDAQSWRIARVAQIALYAWGVAVVATVVVDITRLTSP